MATKKAAKPKKSFFAHPNALVESDTIGQDTRIWAFCHVMKGAVIGRNCNIGDHCYIENGARVGDDVVVKNGVSIWDGITIGDNVFVGPNASFINDRVPRAKLFHDQYSKTLVGKGASIGTNATIMCDIRIGEYALVGAGSMVTKDVGDHWIVYGNPATLRGYLCKCGKKLDFREADSAQCVCGCRYVKRGEKVRLVSG